MHVILVSVGSLGDTLPFLEIGKALRRRGHQVTMIANEHYAELIGNAGLELAPNLSEQDYRDFLYGQERWSAVQALAEMGEIVKRQLRKGYELVLERYEPGRTVVAAQGYALGCRVAQEKHGVPLATVHLQPLWFRSVYDPPGAPGWFPRWMLQGIDRAVSWVLDAAVGRETNALRGELGLPPVKQVMKAWWNSPDCVLALFPEWFNPPQPDWPRQTRCTGFPLDYDQMFPRNGDLETFLAAGDPPVVFIQSSVKRDADDYFSASVEAVRMLGKRAILLTPHVEQVPPNLPDSVRHFEFVPLEQLLPRAAAFVHHGGIGAIGHSLTAGAPQLVVPMIYDQPDNSERLRRLGVSAHLKPREYRAEAVARQLRRLLESSEVAERCRLYADRIRGTQPLGAACEALESLEGTDRR